MTKQNDIWQCSDCGKFQGKHDMWFDGKCESCKNKIIIDSSYYDEHKKELVLYIGEAIYCTISCDTDPSDNEVDEIIYDIERQHK